MHHERHACGLAGLHHGLGIGQRSGEGLLNDDGDAETGRQLHQGPVAWRRGGDVHEVKPFRAQHRVRFDIAAHDAKAVAGDGQALRILIADGHDLCPRGIAPAMQVIDGEETAPDQRTAKLRHVARPLR